MLRPAFTLPTIALVLTLFAATDAAATAQRTFVASYGLAANTAFNCSIVKPCRAFGDAIGVTTAGGEVIVLDSAGYGAFTTSQSVSVIAPAGVYAGISVFTGTGIVISGTGVRVVLRGLTVNGLGGTTGVSVNAANSEVHLEGITVSSINGLAIYAFGAGTRVHIKDAELRSNSSNGIYITSGALVYVDRSRIEENANFGVFVIDAGELYLRDSIVHRNGTGISANVTPGTSGYVRLVVERTLISGSTFGGIDVQVQGTGASRVDAVVTGATLIDNAGAGYSGINFQCFNTAAGSITLTDSTISHHLAGNADGFQVAGTNCVASLGRNTFTRNVTGMSGSTPTLTSFGNNQFDRNGTDIAGTFTTKATQ